MRDLLQTNYDEAALPALPYVISSRFSAFCVGHCLWRHIPRSNFTRRSFDEVIHL